MKTLSKEQIADLRAQAQANKTEDRIVQFEKSNKYEPIHFIGSSSVGTKKGIVNYTPKGKFVDKGRKITETPKAPSDESTTRSYRSIKTDKYGYPCGTRKSETTHQDMRKKGKTVRYAHPLHNLESKDVKAMNNVNKK